MTRQRPRTGHTLIELLVVIAIMGILAGLLLSGVQKVRESANLTQCRNQIKQLALACHTYHNDFRRLPPWIGWSGQGYGNALFHLLPYIEQNNLYKKSEAGDILFAGNNNVYASPIPLLQCPSDPSLGPNGVQTDNQGKTWGGNTYAGNVCAFAHVDPYGNLIHLDRHAHLGVAGFPDGTSNTILFGEKYARCTNFSYPEGGNFWAYWDTSLNAQPLHPAFAISWNAYCVNTKIHIQFQPSPFRGNCDPTLPSTPHIAMPVAMADGSVHSISQGVSGTTLWALCTPGDGDMPGSDWGN
jgi:prepilin-type N-terminal cleavage/methylation domain-containing protein